MSVTVLRPAKALGCAPRALPCPLSLTTAGREGRQPFFQKEFRPLTIGPCPRTPHNPWEKSLGSPCPPPDMCPVLVWPQKDPLTVYRQATSGASLRGLPLHQLAVSRTPGKLGWWGQGGQPVLPPGESGQDFPSLSLPGHTSKTTLPWKPGACPRLSYCLVIKLYMLIPSLKSLRHTKSMHFVSAFMSAIFNNSSPI